MMTHRILHTSDWHIGRRLKERDRTREFTAFFEWLAKTIEREKPDTLLAAGDIFDNTTPSIQSQDMYYSFLSTIAKSSCRHIVIISGNHDSPAFLDAPAKILALNDIHVIGQARENPADEVITLCDENGHPELIVCAVPYLRDRDVRTMTASDSPADTERALTEGIRSHYAEVFGAARKEQESSGVPVVAMGHMFVSGGRTRPDDGVRSLYVGTALQVDGDIFPDWVSYTALGHLHSPQAVGKKNIRYSGSPIQMGFGEAGQRKAVYIVELEGKDLADIREMKIPCFQRLEQVSGDLMTIAGKLNGLGRTGESVWADVTYNGQEVVADLQERLAAFTKAFPNLEILSIRDESRHTSTSSTSLPDGIENLKPIEMLELCFDANDTSKEQREIFTPMYIEILRGLGEDC